MDTIDVNILALLEENGRMPVKEISGRINLTSPAVSERIKRMEKHGVIKGYQANISHSHLGIMLRAIVNIVMKVDKYDGFYALAAKDPAIVECYHVTGSYTMAIIVAVREVGELERLLNKITKYGETNTQIILSSPFERKGYVNH